MTTDPKRFGPFIGGCVGGSVGYLTGLTFGPVAAVGMFFLGAYVGYDFRTAARIFGRALYTLADFTVETSVKTGVSVAEGTRTFAKWFWEYGFILIPWTLATILMFTMFVGDLYRMRAYELSDVSFMSVGENVRYTADLGRVLITGESAYESADEIYHQNSFESLRGAAVWMVLTTGTLAAIVSLIVCLGTAMAGAIVFFWFIILCQILLKWRQWPLTVAWALFWLVALPTVGVAWVVAASLTAMYSVRRLACGIVTIATGMSYLFLVPVPTSSELIGAAAIGCGLACGLTAHGLFALVGIPAVMARLRALRERTLASFAPLPALSWWDVVRGRREPCEK